MNKHYFLMGRLVYLTLRYNNAGQFSSQTASRLRRLFPVFGWLVYTGLVWTSCDPGGDSGPTSIATPSQAASGNQATTPDGATVYRQYCITCHGADGKLGLNGAGDLTKSNLSLPDRITQISKGKNMMTAFEEILAPEEIEAVATFTLSLKK